MKKERNAFFQNNSSSSYFYPTTPMMNMPSAYPMATESNSNFYQGPAMPLMQAQSTNDYNSELESRLAKIERQLNRFDTRISKLESEYNQYSAGTDYTTNNMYMV